MRNLAVITLTLCVAALMIQISNVFADDIHNQRGLEVRGGFSHYFMDDPNDFIDAYPDNFTKTTAIGSPMFGVSLLYKTHQHFGWNIGYNYLMNSVSKAEGPQNVGTIEQKIHASELFAMGCYYKTVMTDWTLSLGLGLNAVFGAIEREETGGAGFMYADGRTLGFITNIGLEFPLKETLGLKLSGGYRGDLINEVHVGDIYGEGSLVYFGLRPLELDFSGFYGQLGVCFYFDPVTHFKTYAD